MELDNIHSLDGEEWKYIPGYEGQYNVLKYIDANCCLKEPSNDGLGERDMLELDKMLRSVFYAFVGKQDRPIEEQDEQCIEFVYSLIKK